ncbi:hypothetical protein [Sneathiella chinensis]|uniref:Acyl-CoA synthetase n=1 Tax=Sneathiella chinensis TaxID=349750 RepID=A0ABQ5U2H2_9PROT|nr:hypothetical protein [Sneathiella chinensis]GLQ06360.1 hypothetical protein GCM10007924_15810 [Sneathiella chinensis]
MSKTATRKSGNGLFPILVFTGLCSVFAPPTMLIIGVGMLPTLVAALARPGGVRGSIAAMLALNLAGVIPVVGMLWRWGHTLENAISLLTDVFMWLLMFGGAGVAAFLLWGVPILVHAAYEVQAQTMIKRLEKRRIKLIEEWGGQIIEDAKYGAGRKRPSGDDEEAGEEPDLVAEEI